MPATPTEITTTRALPLRREQVDRWPLVRRIPGRNRTKADIRVHRAPWGIVALKDYSGRAWPIRNTLGRLLLRRESRAYAAADGLPGLPRFLGRVGPFALATEWIDATPLAEFEGGSVEAGYFDQLERIVVGLHERGVVLADLNYRDILLADNGSTHLVDLAAAWIEGRRPGWVRRRLFRHFLHADRFAVARLRSRYVGEDPSIAIRSADPAVLAWHRRARRVKWYWDRLRGAERLPPVDDHWRF